MELERDAPEFNDSQGRSDDITAELDAEAGSGFGDDVGDVLQ